MQNTNDSSLHEDMDAALKNKHLLKKCFFLQIDASKICIQLGASTFIFCFFQHFYLFKKLQKLHIKKSILPSNYAEFYFLSS